VRELWIFGYGSLVWRPAFAYRERCPAFVRGWTRRFWQGSTDHRGVPGAPGRVVTLVPDPRARCWGMAYRVAPGVADDVLEALDRREQGGYERHQASLHISAREDRTEEGLVYVASRRNPNYLGPAPLDSIAEQVLGAHGPSGANVEYVLSLAEALRGLGAEDDHVFALAERVAERGARPPATLRTPAASGRPSTAPGDPS
jgi:cation transport regulator ChaC